jgi:hypothetical protein
MKARYCADAHRARADAEMRQAGFARRPDDMGDYFRAYGRDRRCHEVPVVIPEMRLGERSAKARLPARFMGARHPPLT